MKLYKVVKIPPSINSKIWTSNLNLMEILMACPKHINNGNYKNAMECYESLLGQSSLIR